MSFHVDTRVGDTIADMLYKTLEPIHIKHTEVTYKVATYRLYTIVENTMMIKYRLGMCLYGTIIEDIGPGYSNMLNTELKKEGDWVYQFSKIHVALTLYKWRYSVDKGYWFLSTFHDNTKITVMRRTRVTKSRSNSSERKGSNGEIYR